MNLLPLTGFSMSDEISKINKLQKIQLMIHFLYNFNQYRYLAYIARAIQPQFRNFAMFVGLVNMEAG